MITSRNLARSEIPCIWSIDRREVIDAVYYHEAGKLVLKPEHYDMQGWPPGEPEKYSPLLEACFDRGGWFLGLFDDGQLAGVAVLDNRYLGREQQQLQLKLLHVSREWRGQGMGRRLFRLAAEETRRRGARQLYISATPSEHTVNFYLNLGCFLAAEPDPDLLALEPEDIHLVFDIPQQ